MGPELLVSSVTGHPVVPSRMIYNNIISKKHSHYPQLLGTSYKVSVIISLKKFCHFYAQGKTIYNVNFIQKFVTNDDMR